MDENNTGCAVFAIGGVVAAIFLAGFIIGNKLRIIELERKVEVHRSHIIDIESEILRRDSAIRHQMQENDRRSRGLNFYEADPETPIMPRGEQ